MSELKLTSSAFGDGELMPEKYGYTARNVNPPLEIDGVNPGTKSLVLIMDDPDALEPAGKVWDHWIVWNMEPSVKEIPEDWEVSDPREGLTDYGEACYGGPNPPDGVHTYVFKLYALDTKLDFNEPPTKDDLEDAMDGHILEETRLEGQYAPN